MKSIFKMRVARCRRTCWLILLSFACLTTVGSGACRAQFVTADWEEIEAPRRRPRVASGLLIYVPPQINMEISKAPVAGFFLALARSGNWDILRINRVNLVDDDAEDDNQLRFIGDQIARARTDGYRQIVIGGHMRGAWLALSAAKLDGVDAAIGFTPITIGRLTKGLEWQRDELAARLSVAKAKRIAVFFFSDDANEAVPREAVPRADATLRALERSGASFMVIDRPPGWKGIMAPWREAFIRKYQHCVLRFLEEEAPAGASSRCANELRQ
jgi:hypothetical protein